MSILSRRQILATGAVAGGAALAAASANAATTQSVPVFGNPDAPGEGAINARGNPGGLSDPGPKNPGLANEFPSFQDPPATDVEGMPLFWASFNNAHKRIQNGGWAREVTQDDFAISKDISGVNMRLAAGGVRELHWHQQAEWAYMLDGKCRITTIDSKGRASIQDVKAGDLWYFPPGLPHALQGLGPTGCEFMIVFDNGKATEFNTLMVTDWVAHTPPDVLAKNFGVPADTFKNIPLHNLWIFQGSEPPSLAQAQAESASPLGKPDKPVIFSLGDMKPNKVTRGGTVQIADSTNFPISQTIAAALVTVKPGGLRELHWHPNADEWQFYIKGKARMTVFNTGPKAQTADFRPGDVGYIPKSLGHYVENVGDEDLQFLEIFKADKFEEVSLSEWLVRTPRQLVADHLNIPVDVINRFPQVRPDILPL